MGLFLSPLLWIRVRAFEEDATGTGIEELNTLPHLSINGLESLVWLSSGGC